MQVKMAQQLHKVSGI